jgi:hypothetical protein
MLARREKAMLYWTYLVIAALILLPLGVLAVAAAMRSSQCSGSLESALLAKRDREAAEAVTTEHPLRRSA